MEIALRGVKPARSSDSLPGLEKMRVTRLVRLHLLRSDDEVEDDGEVAACESDSSRLTVFAADGKLLAQLASRGSKPGMLDAPSAVAADRLGRIYVADTRNHRVQVFRIVARRGDAAH